MTQTGTSLIQVFKKADETAELITLGKDITTTLTESEKQRFEVCEEVINKGLHTFLEVGSALAEIRDYELYKETHKAFKKYCKDVWDLGRATAYQKIDGSQAVNLLQSKVSAIADTFEKETGKSIKQDEIILPMNEAQARKLTKLKNPDDLVKAWVDVLVKRNKNPKTKLTAALIHRSVKEVSGVVWRRNIDKTKKQLDATQRVSKLFNRRIQNLIETIDDEHNSGWQTTSRKEAVKWLNDLIKLVLKDD